MTASGLGGLRVLVADDNKNTRSMMKTVLQGLGIDDVIFAGDGDEALDALQGPAVDFVIVDHLMPAVGGVAFTQEVRTSQSSRNPYLPIIMMTGHGDRRRILEARDAGVTEIISKPLVINSLVRRMNAIIIKPRAFVRSAAYFGPGRRRQAAPAYRGPLRRKSDRVAASEDWEIL